MAGWASRKMGTSAQFLGAHAETMQALAKLQLLVQVTPGMSLKQRQKIATETVRELWPLVKRHHQDEEELLFPAMLERARGQFETAMVDAYIGKLTKEHREIEGVWEKVRPGLVKLSHGVDIELAGDACHALAQLYQAHAQFEETVILPLAAQLLTHDDQDSISLSLALRHNVRNLTAYI